MNIIFRYLTFFALLQVAWSSETASKLHGSWLSDGKATNSYFSEHAKLTDQQNRLFPKFFGRAVFTFNPDGSGTIKMEAVILPKKDGGDLNLAASETAFKYQILGETESQIVIKTTLAEPMFNEYPFTILKFHDADTYSVSLSDGIADINGREFFKRR